MLEIIDEYAKRAFENISEVGFKNKSLSGELYLIKRYFGVSDIEKIPEENATEYLNDRYDIRTRKIRLEGDWYKGCATPILANYGEEEKAVLPDSCGRCSYFDKGKKIRITKKNADLFSVDAVCFYKGLGNGKISVAHLIKFMLKSVTAQEKILAVIASVLATLTGLIFPFANYMIFNYVIPSGSIGDAFPIAALLVGVTGTIAMASMFQLVIFANVISKVGVNVESALFSRILKLNSGFFKDRNTGEFADIITDFSDIGNILSVDSLTAAIGIILSVVYLVQMHSYAPELMGIAAGAGLITILASVRETIQLVKWQREYIETNAKLSGFVYEFFSLMEKIKLSGAATRMFERWSEKYRIHIIKSNKPFQLKYSLAISKAITLTATLVIFIAGAKADLPMANYIAFNSAYGSFIVAISGIGKALAAAAAFISSVKLLKPVLDADTESRDDEKKISDIKGDIEISNLKFKYAPELPYVIDGIDLKIRQGESIGIVGASGCGKSTLLRLLLGFENITEGGILIDGVDLREINLKSYRRRIGVVLQDSRLLNDDIYSNITITAPDANYDDVADAVEKACLTEDIEYMPMGLRTIVSEENSTISGGQKQRILIARSIINKPPILIFDEATSALDNITQEKIMKNVESLNSTRIMIAHRLSTIKNCDRIIFLHEGKIAEEGSYDELIEKKGMFYSMAQRQLA
ncbi:MAG: ATP-binding cassette domain-containing protein [Oscillospiraceae bacterium]|nr:ATP-binding cassette domain-containing protein [Oscillospiraceae bacterium]